MNKKKRNDVKRFPDFFIIYTKKWSIELNFIRVRKVEIFIIVIVFLLKLKRI